MMQRRSKILLDYSPNMCNRRKIRLMEGNARFLRLKSDLQKDFAAAGYLFEAPSPSRFLSWGGSKSVHIQCETPGEYALQHDSTPPPSHTLSAYTFTRGGGGEGRSYWK
jgi:hypothetical protein